jgi:hypothetical protein
MMRIVPALVLTLVSLRTEAQPAKAAWQWTDEERVASRIDAASAASRVNEARAQTEPGRIHSDVWNTPRPFDIIAGARHPELFLPYEVFQSLLDGALRVDDATAAGTRKTLDPFIHALGLPGDFWQTVRRQSAPFLSSLQAELDVRGLMFRGDAKAAQRLPALHELTCRTRADALEGLRRTFGRETFDRFLYEAFAPNMGSTWLSVPDAETLRREAGGCR